MSRFVNKILNLLQVHTNTDDHVQTFSTATDVSKSYIRQGCVKKYRELWSRALWRHILESTRFHIEFEAS